MILKSKRKCLTGFIWGKITEIDSFSNNSPKSREFFLEKFQEIFLLLLFLKGLNLIYELIGFHNAF